MKGYLQDYTVKPINIKTPQKPKNISTDKNAEQKQKNRDRALNLYQALMTEIIELKGFLMEDLYNI